MREVSALLKTRNQLLEKYLIFAAPKDVRQDVTTTVINRVPEPLSKPRHNPLYKFGE